MSLPLHCILYHESVRWCGLVMQQHIHCRILSLRGCRVQACVSILEATQKVVKITLETSKYSKHSHSANTQLNRTLSVKIKLGEVIDESRCTIFVGWFSQLLYYGMTRYMHSSINQMWEWNDKRRDTFICRLILTLDSPYCTWNLLWIIFCFKKYPYIYKQKNGFQIVCTWWQRIN